MDCLHRETHKRYSKCVRVGARKHRGGAIRSAENNAQSQEKG